MNDKYIPGQCNIGKYESEKRLRTGIFGAILSCSFSFLFYVFAIDKFIVFLVLFGSVFTALLGIIQSRMKFCAYYGILSVFNFETIKSLTSTKIPADIIKDKQKSLEIITISMLGALAYSVIFIILT